MDPKKWVLVGTFPSRMEAEMMAELLEGEGLHPWIQWESIGQLLVLNGSRLAETHLYVPEPERNKAKELLGAFRESGGPDATS